MEWGVRVIYDNAGWLSLQRSLLRHYSRKSRVRLLSLLFGSLLLAGIPAHIGEAQANVGGGEAPWVISHYESGSLFPAPDSSLRQWTGPRILMLESAYHGQMSVISANNGSYVVFLIQRTLTTPLQQAGELVAFEGVGVKGSDQVWY